MAARVVARDGADRKSGVVQGAERVTEVLRRLEPDPPVEQRGFEPLVHCEKRRRYFNYFDQPKGLLLTQNQAIFSRATVESCSSSGEAVANWLSGAHFIDGRLQTAAMTSNCGV